jgi:hypothetical protein
MRNDDKTTWVHSVHERFAKWAAGIPLNNPDGAWTETFTNLNGQCSDAQSPI